MHMINYHKFNRRIIKAQYMESESVVKLVSLDIYKQEVITAAIYKFTDKCFVSQDIIGNSIKVVFMAKQEQPVDLILISREFENELIDQQIRYDTISKFGHIRDMIVEEAFKPVSK